MTKPPAPPRPPYFPAATVREQIAAGPKFEPIYDGARCAACGGFGLCDTTVTDKTTGLGPGCWPSWRWSPTAERSNPNITEPHATAERKGG